ncbi:MAG TPA: hypothetical protein VJ957_12410 [Longimicrobiales bacterium]|nr:hypothetical protein [Longimicrobiales bacterium]
MNDARPRRAVFITPHYWASHRRGGVHWIADAFRRAGWEIVFLTSGMSWPLWIRRKDWRLRYPVREEANRVVRSRDGVLSFVWVTPWHPATLPAGWMNRLSSPLFRLYARFPLGDAEPLVRGADLLVFESSPALLLFDRFRALAPAARTVYRISDDLRLLDYHPVVVEAEAVTIDRFGLLSIPSHYVFQQHQHRTAARFHPQGVRREIFDDDDSPSPYGKGVNAVFVGNSHFDHDFLDRASRLAPDWTFHIIGPIPGLPERANVVAYGEMAFERTVPYLKYADIGLNIRSRHPAAECLAESLKVMQYTYCRLPIVAGEHLRTVFDHVAYYKPGDDTSIRAALDAARAYDRARIDTRAVRTWDEIARDMAAGVGLPLEAP